MDGIDSGVYIKTDQLEKFARNVALSEKLDGRTGLRRTAFMARRALRRLKTRTETLAAAGETAASAQWLMDNWYVAQRAGLDAAAGLVRTGRVPALLSGEPAVYALACALVQAGLGAVDERRLRLFLTGYQQGRALTQRELGALIGCIQTALTAYLDAAGQLKSEDERTAVYENVFASMRFFTGFDAGTFLHSQNRVEQILLRDPAGIYPQMDDESRDAYRRTLSKLAARAGMDEDEAAESVLNRAQERGCHVGTLIFAEKQAAQAHRKNGWWYVPALVLPTLLVSILAGIVLQSAAAAVLLVLPVSEIVKNLMDGLLMRFVRPDRLPRLELKNGIPDTGRTLCVIAALLTGPDSARRYAGLLAQYRLANRDSGKNLLFGLLADLPEAQQGEMPEDGAVLRAAQTAVDDLNRQFGGGFYLFSRPRRYNDAGRCWMGWERKRGALLQLASFLRGTQGAVNLYPAGRAPENVRYLLTLDGDTRLCPWTAKEMVGAALHPLNTPVLDPRTRTVTAGYGVFQPRVSVELACAGKTDFARIFAGRGGVDPYGGTVSDLYQDVFGRGTFTGKGLLDIDAYLACTGTRFRENTVLSHDLLEGALLRCAYMSDTELTDGCPSGAVSWYERMHRWVRGDWQNLRWMLRRVPDAQGGTVPNPLPPVERWKVFDNLRRSLVPVSAFAAVCAGLFGGARALLWAAGAALLAFASQLLITAAQDLLHRFGRRQRLYCAVIPGFAGALMHLLVRLALLPYEAWVCLSAAVTALYRTFVSHRNMLRWVTADQSERGKNTLPGAFRRLWFCVPAGLFTALLAGTPVGIAAGLVWLSAPALAWTLSRPRSVRRTVPEAQRPFLHDAAADCWRYFEENLTDEDHFLPPDNVQEQPALGRAHRTSPTNIGLALLSVLAAADLGLIGREDAASRLARTLDTVERLPKWRGHLYNWYDTRTLAVLGEKSVSSVDSGNLAGCLIALEQGLLELDAPALAQRARRLRQEMDFTALYDAKRALFVISLEPEKNKSAGWYDLLASEARLTSYIAVASGQVARRHWRALGRMTVHKRGYGGLASWTGTMFEYLMPELLLPLYPDSLLDESARFCVAQQRRRMHGGPWGMSEGAYAAFDPSMSYRYKANGVQALALKRGMDSDAVVTPYASFLALAAAPQAAAENLCRLAGLDARGRYGFYEALDFTPVRAPAGGYVPVRTFMAHHEGMSLVAADNALNGGIMVRRFMKNAQMAAFAQLLQEKIPYAGPALRRPELTVPEKPPRMQTPGWTRTLGGVDTAAPEFCPLSNGAYTLLVSETGKSAARLGDMALFLMDPQADGRQGGPAVTVCTAEGEFSPAPWPLFDRETAYETQFSGAGVLVCARRGRLTSRMEMAVSGRENGETRTLELCWNGDAPLEAEIHLFFEPCLLPERDYRAHPAFARLGLQAQLENGALLLTRRPDERRDAVSLCLAASRPAAFGTSKLELFGRGSRMHDGAPAFFSASPEFCAAAVVRLTLHPGRPERTVFTLAPAPTQRQAREAAARLLSAPAERGPNRLDAAAAALNLSAQQVQRALERIGMLLFPAPSARPGGARDALWRLGISGDLPVLAAFVPDESRANDAAELIAEHAFLRENGFSYDLLLLMPDGGDYRRPLRRRLTGLLTEMGLGALEGAGGGVHFADIADPGAADAAGEAAACLVLPETEKPPRQPGRITVPAVETRAAAGQPPETGWLPDGSFTFLVRGRLPEVAWSHVLTNGQYGFLATDAGTGHMWLENARENRINRWLNDPLAVRGTERLTLRRADGREISLFAAEDGYPCRVTWGFGFARWEKTVDCRKISTTAFVPQGVNARFFLIETEHLTSEDVIGYATDLVLGADDRDETAVFTAFDGTALTAESPRFAGRFYLASSCRPLRATGSRDDLAGMAGAFGRTMRPCAAARYPAGETLVLAAGCGEIPHALLDAAACRRVLTDTAAFWARKVRPVRVRTAHAVLDHYLNGWALYQTIACRMLGRTGLYQCGGAYGFRDQLQDAIAAMWSWPALSRETLVRACAHQYVQGDVQHWWHETPDGAGRGVRTRYTDDLLWLPYVLCRYVRATGDTSVLEEKTPWLVSPPLEAEETERYEQPQASAEADTVLNHALRAVELVLSRSTGVHGLCRMGGGDWNDGMNAVGRQGRGESVWLTWFAVMTLTEMAALCPQVRARYTDAARRLRAAAENAWDGAWYLRGWYDSGAPLGSGENDACRIDSVAQSFAAFAGGDAQRVKTALESAENLLFDRKSGVVRLFTPPFDGGAQRPGYIRGYVPGFRENGGQYTHAAVWLALAMLDAGLAERGRMLLLALLPENAPSAVYKAEPYVLPADVSAAPEHMGRAGWTWYTGSAGWYYTAAMEGLLGLELCGGRIVRARPEMSGMQADIVRTECAKRPENPAETGKTPETVHNNFISRQPEM